MIKNIHVTRASVAPSVCEPVTWSDNQQLAVNNGIQLTILDPVLPVLHQSVTSLKNNAQGKEIQCLDAKKLFEVTTILDAEVLEKLDIGMIQNFVIDTLDEGPSFGKIHEPLITGHEWSPLIESRRDCLLGVLFNTSELFIFERATALRTEYKVKMNILEELMLHMPDTSYKILDNAFNISNEGAISLKVHSFKFSSSPQQQHILLSLGLGNSNLSLYCVDDELIKLGEVKMDAPVLKQCWTDWISQEKALISYIFTISSVNSVDVLQVAYNDDDTYKVTKFGNLKKSSRFLITRTTYFIDGKTCFFIIASTGMLTIHKIEDISKISTTKYALTSDSLVCGLDPVEENSHLYINIAFEDGKFEQVTFGLQNSSIERGSNHKVFTDFSTRELYKFQLANSTQDGSVGIKDNNGITKPYLNDIVEGHFLNFGTIMNVYGLTAIVHTIIPKNTLNYTILSKCEFWISFIASNYHNKTENKNQTFQGTSLGYLNEFWFRNYELIPKLPSPNAASKDFQIFLDELISFKSKNFVEIDKTVLTVVSYSSLATMLQENVSRNNTVFQLQRLYNFDMSLIISLNALESNLSSVDHIKSYKEILRNEMIQVERLIFEHLAACVLEFASKSGLEIQSEIDKFIILSYYLLVPGVVDPNALPHDAKVNLRSRGLVESFELTISDLQSPNSREICLSKNNNEWSRCALTLIPIIGMQSKTDESEIFNYSNFNSTEMDNTVILNALNNILDFCIYTGNRRFAACNI